MDCKQVIDLSITTNDPVDFISDVENNIRDCIKSFM